jgi:addiction module HigA family antidote
MAKKTKRAPAAVHPGEILREEFLKPLGMSANRLAIELRVPAPRMSEIVRERRAISAETALRLARFFRTTPDFWMNLQMAYDLRTAEHRVGMTVAREVSPRAA